MAEEKTTEPIPEHVYVPKHEIIAEDELSALLAEYGIQKSNLPKLLKNDPAIRHLKSDRGDVIKITRTSRTAGQAVYYRVVI